ncbi:MFS transporter [Ornithinimicrobium sp. F0845]|uniref:uridine transporter UriT n=1 Tax=Ornithinimicrobium sp. F0845 TaxID=2926412 RepID=UPI001FF28311|nr:MFS transporter [Ornithinimicrobium sp. F0845]MCK0114026.1 MFS transporter [Ornithinimicrobium sp. F0845]
MSTVPPTPRRTTGSVPALVAALLAAIFAFQLNASMLSPVLATMERELDTTAAQIGLSQTAFFASAALFSLFLPRWGDLIGRKRLMIGILVLTGVGSVISAVAPNVEVLSLGRIVQGVSGPIVPMALIMLRVQVPDPRRYAKLMAILTAINGGIAGVDALLGGWLAETFGFRSVFWVMAVVAALAVLAIAAGTLESRSPGDTRMDWKGVSALVVVLGSLYFAFDQAGRLAEANWLMVVGLMVLAAVAFAVFWAIETRVEHPLVTTTYLKERRTWALLSTTLLTMTGVFAVMNGLIPNLAQDPALGGISAGEVSWWTLTPYALAGLVMGPIAGQLAARMGYKRVLQGGLVLTTLGLTAAAFLSSNPTPFVLLSISVFIGVTYAGVCNIMLNGLGIVLSPRDNQGYLPGMNSGAFNLGAGLSFALLFAINTFVTNQLDAAAGYRFGILAGAVLLLLALAVSLLIPQPEDDEVVTGHVPATATEGADHV